MTGNITTQIAAAAAESPDLKLVTRTGPRSPLTAAHVDRLRELIDTDPAADYTPGAVAHVDRDGVVTTVDQGVGTWTVTAHRDGAAQWLTISEPDGPVLAQRETDLADVDAVALSMYVLWGWATVGPEVF